MKCTKCNNEIPEGSKFCNHCGAKIEMVEGIKCQCGYVNPSDAVYCTECGKKIKKRPLFNSVHNKDKVIGFAYDGTYIKEEYYAFRIIGLNTENGIKYGLKNIKGLLILPFSYFDMKFNGKKGNGRTCLLTKRKEGDEWEEYVIPSLYQN